MSNTSASAGYLTPQPSPPGPEPLYGDELDVFLQHLVVGITGMQGKMVRPRWQPESVNLPTYNDDWCALGVQSIEAEAWAYENHHADDDGKDTVQRNEDLTVLLSFYGPNSMRNMSFFRDGVQVSQNREVLQLATMGLISCTSGRQVPEKIKERWWKRWDIEIVLRRLVQHDYAVENVESAEFGIHTDVGIGPVDVVVTQPEP